MQTKSPSSLRYGILLLPVIAIAGYIIVTGHASKPAAANEVKSYGKEITWVYCTINPPGFQGIDSPKLAVARTLGEHEKGSSGAGMFPTVMATPRHVQYHVNAMGFDTRYRKGVSKFTLGNRSFTVDNAQTLHVGNKTIPLGSTKTYLTFGKAGSISVSSTPPKWYTALNPTDRGNASKAHIVEQDVQNLNVQFTSDSQYLSGRALRSVSLSAIDCGKFAIGVRAPKSAAAAGPDSPTIVHVDIVAGGPGNANIFANGVNEQYENGTGRLTVGSTEFKILDHGTSLQTPSGPLVLKGAKKYITVSPDHTMKVASAKPAWFAVFDKAPPTPPSIINTVSPE